MDLRRWLRHWFTPRFVVKRRFDAAALAAISSAIAEGEQRHDGQLRFAVEGAMPWSYLARDAHPRERAVMAFSKLRVWDTARNTGVLIYVNLADRDVEIVADRGVAHSVGERCWRAICSDMEAAFAAGRWHAGALAGVASVHAALVDVAPRIAGDAVDELPDLPVIL